jgi:hypothetical protein
MLVNQPVRPRIGPQALGKARKNKVGDLVGG